MSATVQILELRFSGHLTVEQLRRAFDAFELDLAQKTDGPLGIIVDALEMTGYDQEARAAFVTWFRMHRKLVVGTAFLTHNTLWHMVITAMSLASGVSMKPFRSREEATRWLQSSSGA